AMYFTIGGRKTQSALYRVSYTGSEPPANLSQNGARSLERRQLEAFHGKQDPKAIDVAWPYLNHEDRFIRSAARVALEHQPVSQWSTKALEETDPHRSITALLALTRTSAPCPYHRRPTDQPVDAK